MRVLVTGARGFIGRRLVPRLRDAGGEVIEYAGDVRAAIRCETAVDVVVHLAGALRGDAFRDDPARAFETNVVGTANVLRLCETLGARCVLASTSAVYPSSDTPLAETVAAAPRSPYGTSKWLAERLCEQWAGDGDRAAVVLRLFNVYGPGQDASFIAAHVAECLRRGRAVDLQTPQAVRDFVHVDDVAAAFRRAAESRETGLRVYNVGTGVGFRIIDFVALAAAATGLPAQVTAPPASSEPDTVVASIAAIQAALGWTARIDLREGLRDMIRDPVTGDQ
ncbi:MAG: NAD-dependent epimerase/dehydratase family protein [Candidatus Binatia bacterium]